MRTLPLLLALAATTALTGCDLWHKPPPPKPVTVTCNCNPPIRGSRDVEIERTVRETPAPRRAHYRGHGYRHYASGHRYYRGHRYQWHQREAERAVEIYNYSSSSHSYGSGHSGYGYGYGGHGSACCGDDRLRAGESTRVWADGYGRRHIYDQSAVRHYSYQAHVARAQEADRLDPWHGYDDDWDW